MLGDRVAGAGKFYSGITGGGRKPYSKYMDEYNNWVNKSEGVQRPYLEAGERGLGNYEDWLQGQKDPAKFINSLTENYQQSPYNTYLQQQAQNAGNNAASAGGLVGSTPFAQFQQQSAANIGQQGMNDWLQKVLGINTQYGEGQNTLAGRGQNAANSLTNMYGQAGRDLGEAAYGRQAGGQQDTMDMITGLLGMFGL